MTELSNQDKESWEDEDLESENNDYEEYETTTFQYDPEKINIATREPTIEQLLRRIDEKALDLAPEFQRQANIWNQEAKSRLIESILIRIPLPAFYIDGTNEDEWVVVDGLQRLSALKQFVENRLNLTGLEYLDLKNKTYDELERRYQRRILETQVTVYLIEKGTPEEVKYNIFKRINTGGVRLSNQELRHALNPGQSAKFLASLASLPEFTQVVNLSESKKKRMDDREFILGFLAFYIFPYQTYQDNTRDAFFHKAMSKINKLSPGELDDIQKNFQKSMNIGFDIFGDKAFRKLSGKTNKKFPVNKALFEVWSVNLSKLSDEDINKLKVCKQQLLNEFIWHVDNDKEFLASISQAANKVEYRFKTVEKILTKVLYD